MSRGAIAIVVLVPALALVAGPPASLPKDTLPETISLTDIPLGLGDRPVPKDQPLTAARVRLGRKLFFDPVLSGDGSISCASCHRPDHGFGSPDARPKGIRGQEVSRKAPPLLNRAYGKSFFWDGRAASLEEQSLQPIENPKEMGSSVADVLGRLKASDDYRKLFAAAFPDGITAPNLASAIAAFERTLLDGNSRVDQFRVKGEHKALTPSERAGLWIYESKGGCWRCHSGSQFTDEGFHNTGVRWGGWDLGRFEVTRKEEDRGKFKTPTLRGLSKTAPYMHDGSLKTLDEVVEFYDRGGTANPYLDPAMRPLKLSKEEKADLVAFLKAL